MADLPNSKTFPTPTIITLGDSALLVRFGTTLSDEANRAAIALALLLEREPLQGVVEIAPNLVSVLLRYDPLTTQPSILSGELRLRLFALKQESAEARAWNIPVVFDGPDLDEVAAALALNRQTFIAAHCARTLRVLATGFAPGFVYCGLHEAALVVPRRMTVRPSVPAGSVLFAAGQTAITATEMPTGWHVIGRTGFSNFHPAAARPTELSAGDLVNFSVLA